MTSIECNSNSFNSSNPNTFKPLNEVDVCTDPDLVRESCPSRNVLNVHNIFNHQISFTVPADDSRIIEKTQNK